MTITGPVIRVSGEDVLHKALWVFIFWGCAPWTSSQSRGYWCERMSSWLIYKMRMSEICFTLQAKDFTAWWPNEAGLAQPTRLKEVSKSEGFPISYKAASPAGVEVCMKNTRYSVPLPEIQNPICRHRLGKQLWNTTPLVSLRAISTVTQITPSAPPWPYLWSCGLTLL